MGVGGTAIDMSFALAGTRLPAEYAAGLASALDTALPWFPGEPRAGIHPLRAAASTQGMLVLARRARLVLRLPSSRAPESAELCGRTLEVAGERVTIGGAVEHELAPSGTLYAHRVVTGARDELSFHADIERWRAESGIRCEFISGRARRIAGAGYEAVGFGLALHGLSAADSLRVQVEGIGVDRRLGCGIFVPHKAIATPAD
jgi:CRISPR-associated protein Cas6